MMIWLEFGVLHMLSILKGIIHVKEKGKVVFFTVFWSLTNNINKYNYKYKNRTHT